MKQNKVNGNKCIILLLECITNSSNTYEDEWSKLNWKNGIDLESMDYDNAIKIAKIIGLDKNCVATVVSTLNNKYNKNISYSVIMTFQAIKDKILMNNLMKGGDDINYPINELKKILFQLDELLNNSGKKINSNDLTKIKMFINKKIIIENTYNMLLDRLELFIYNLENKKIVIPDEMKELTLLDIKKLLETVD